MSNIEPDFLDISKQKMQDKYGYPQYFTLFFEFEGVVKKNILEEAFYYVNHSIKKNAHQLIFHQKKSEYVECSYHNYFIHKKVNESKLHDAIRYIMENSLIDIVDKSNHAPIICMLLENDSGKFLVALFMNHVHADAASAYFIFKNIVNNYNQLLNHQPLSIMPDFCFNNKNILSFKDKMMFFVKLFKVVCFTILYKYKLRKLKPIYNDAYKNDSARYLWFTIPKTVNPNLDQSLSSNILISSAICKALFRLKKAQINSLSFAMPANVRKWINNNEFLYGNYVSALSIKLNKSDDIVYISKSIRQQLNYYLKENFPIVSYYFNKWLSRSISSNSILKMFIDFSKNHQCYISNYGYYNKDNDENLYFAQSKLIHQGAFNFPLQANLGLVFVLTPYHDSIGVSICTSPHILSENELNDLIILIKEFYLK